jgi:Xaa-Pro aminopeptidase
VLFVDCGIKIGGYCSDLQRTYYVCKEKGEFNPPQEAQKAFRVVYEGITLAAEMMKPGVLGWQVDAACRGHIVSLGYPEYRHATGHGIGLLAHDGAAGLFPRWERYGNRPFIPLKENEVYTIEPRISVPDMGIVTVEEMVVVAKEGGRFLSERQEKLASICFEPKDYRPCED